MTLEKEQSKQFRSRYLGQAAEVLLEEQKEIGGKSYFLGHTRDYVRIALPMDKQALLQEAGLSSNMLVEVRVKGFLTEEILVGELSRE